jgi:DNA-directed RNA polymerase specialized sigma24 family protein
MNFGSHALTEGSPGPSSRPATAAAAHTDVGTTRAGRDALFASFYGRHRRPITEALALTLGDTHLAAEAADEGMVRAYQRWATVSTYGNPEGWVYRVGLNWAKSFLRRLRRAPQPFSQGFVDPSPPGEPSVTAALQALDVDQRAVVVCRFYLGLSEAETASVLGIRPGTAKSRLHRGLRRLSSQLDHLRPEDLR